MKLWIALDNKTKKPIRDDCGMYTGRTKGQLLDNLAYTRFEETTFPARCSLEKDGDGLKVSVAVTKRGKPINIDGIGYLLGTKEEVSTVLEDFYAGDPEIQERSLTVLG